MKAAWLAPGQPLQDLVQGASLVPFTTRGSLYPGTSHGAGHCAGWLLGTAEGAHDAWLLDGLGDEVEAYFASAPSSPPGTPVLAAEVGTWVEQAERWARLMAVAAGAEGASKEAIFAGLEARLQALYARPYLPRGAAERTLALLRALLQVGA